MKLANEKMQSSSIIGKQMTITGEVICSGTVQIDGTISGSLHGETVTIGASGSVEGEINAEHLDCYGQVHGGMAAKRVALHERAAFSGNAGVGEFTMHPAASFVGSVKVSGAAEQPVPPIITTNEGRPPGEGSQSSQTPQSEAQRAEAATDPAVLVHLESLETTISGGSRLVVVVSESVKRRRQMGDLLKQRFTPAFQVLFVGDPSGSVRDVFLRIAEQIGAPLTDYGDKSSIRDAIFQHLNTLGDEKKRIILCLDNSEKMFPATLEGILQLFHGPEDSASENTLVLIGSNEVKHLQDAEESSESRLAPDCLLELDGAGQS